MNIQPSLNFGGRRDDALDFRTGAFARLKRIAEAGALRIPAR
jgi:hypothetical protein